MKSTWEFYNLNAGELVEQYKKVSPEKVYYWLADLLPSNSKKILDLGAGSGRDAAWLAGKGLNVFAVEPSPDMRDLAIREFDLKKVVWIEDHLPDLTRLKKRRKKFDLILLNDVWDHIPPPMREKAFNSIVHLLNPKGLLAVVYRKGGNKANKETFHVNYSEIEELAEKSGLARERIGNQKDEVDRGTVTWNHVLFRKPFVRYSPTEIVNNIIHGDHKRTTYKLGLLRTLLNIARTFSQSNNFDGLCQSEYEDKISLPTGMIGLYWIRLYIPLLAAGLPQHTGKLKLGILSDEFKQLLEIPNIDLRLGITLVDNVADLVHKTIGHVADTIKDSPVRHTFYKGSDNTIFKMDKVTISAPPRQLCLNFDYLNQFGKFKVPLDIWQVFKTGDNWLEYEIVSKWSNMIEYYHETNEKKFASQAMQTSNLDTGTIAASMIWNE